MKTSHQVIGALLAVGWFLAYVGGGAFLFATKAVSNLDYVPPYMPLLIFTWIAGFFVGHAVLSLLFQKAINTKTKTP